MCWLLIRARSNPKASAYKAGDVVEVRRDDCNWGTAEGLPSFYRVQITDLPFSERLQELVQRLDRTLDGLDDDNRPKYILNRIRLHKIDVDTIPDTIKNQLRNTGVIQVTKAQIRNYFKNNSGTVVDIDG